MPTKTTKAPKTKTNTPGKRGFGAEFPLSLHALLQEHAKKNRRSINGEICFRLLNSFENEKTLQAAE